MRDPFNISVMRNLARLGEDFLMLQNRLMNIVSLTIVSVVWLIGYSEGNLDEMDYLYKTLSMQQPPRLTNLEVFIENSLLSCPQLGR